MVLYSLNYPMYIFGVVRTLPPGRASERNFCRRYEDRCRAPKIRWRAKKKKVFTQIWSQFFPRIRWRAKKKKVFTQIWSQFFPRIRWRAKKKRRSSLKFGPSFSPKLGEEQKKRSSLKLGPVLLQNFCPRSETQIGQGEKNSCSKTERDSLNS